MIPTLGHMIRGLRMGYAWYEPARCFIRVSGRNPFKFEFHPAGLVPNHKTPEPHWCWWETGRVDLQGSAFIRGIKRVKRPFVAYLDDNGDTV